MSDRIVQVGMGVFIFKNGKFLMGKRSAPHGRGTWAVPGGHVEFGESFEDTAKREVKEETGLEITNVRFGAVTSDFFESTDKHYITIWMLSDYISGKPVVKEPEKYVDQKWVSFGKLPEPLFNWDRLVNSVFFDEILRESKKS